MKIIDGIEYFSKRFTQAYGVMFTIFGFLLGFWMGFGLK